MPPHEKQYLSDVEVPDEYPFSRTWLQRKRVTGDGPPFVKLGPGRFAPVRYRRCDLEAYIQANLRNSTSAPGLVTT